MWEESIFDWTLCNFIEIALRHGFSPVNLLHIFRTHFPKSTWGRLLLFITKWDTYYKVGKHFYKVWQLCIRTWGKNYCKVGQVIYYKMRRLLSHVGQSSLKSGAGITKWGNYWKVEQYNTLQTTFVDTMHSTTKLKFWIILKTLLFYFFLNILYPSLVPTKSFVFFWTGK